MRLIITCQHTNCRKRFKVVAPGQRSDYAPLRNELRYVECPYCNAQVGITWPRGVNFRVDRRFALRAESCLSRA